MFSHFLSSLLQFLILCTIFNCVSHNGINRIIYHILWLISLSIITWRAVHIATCFRVVSFISEVMLLCRNNTVYQLTTGRRKSLAFALPFKNFVSDFYINKSFLKITSIPKFSSVSRKQARNQPEYLWPSWYYSDDMHGRRRNCLILCYYRLDITSLRNNWFFSIFYFNYFTKQFMGYKAVISSNHECIGVL